MESPMSQPWLLLVAALIPMLIGFVWYNPKVLGNAWMKSAGLTEEQLKGGKMWLIFGLAYIFSVFLAFLTYTVSVHASGLTSLWFHDPAAFEPNAVVPEYITQTMENIGQNGRTFKHGLFHGILLGISAALPLIGTNALFERKGFKYIAINTGYWIVSLGLMGGVIAQWI